jgi:hypothetical protein
MMSSDGCEEVDTRIRAVDDAIGDVCVVVESTQQPATKEPVCEDISVEKDALDKCSKEVAEDLESVQEEDWNNPVTLSVLCR